MNLSQDEINALLSGTSTTDDADGAAEDAQASAGAAEEVNAAGDFVTGGSDDLDDLFARIGDESVSAPEPAPITRSAVIEPNDDEDAPQAMEGMLTADEIDILGEVGNISMGAVATTMYTLLERRVNITTPRVSVYSSKDVLKLYKVPFVVVTVSYVEGITGNNLLVLKVPDAALITDLLMGGDGNVQEPIELTEMHLSAISEIMNQMMGASSTSLAKLLQTPINISTPKSANVDVDSDISEMLENSELVVKISFDMEIEGLLNSELLQLIPYELSRQLAKKFLAASMGEDVSEPAPAPAPPPPPPPAPAPAAPSPAPEPAPYPQQPAQPYPAQPYPEQPYPAPPYPEQAYAPPPYPQQPYPPYPQQPYPPYPQQPYPQSVQPRGLVDVHPMQFQSFDSDGGIAGAHNGIGLVQDIPLQVTVELGKAKKEISEILEFNTGSIVVLDKIAGDPVEIVVNGKLIARGEVVVIEENYGVRITDIING